MNNTDQPNRLKFNLWMLKIKFEMLIIYFNFSW